MSKMKTLCFRSNDGSQRTEQQTIPTCPCKERAHRKRETKYEKEEKKMERGKSRWSS